MMTGGAVSPSRTSARVGDCWLELTSAAQEAPGQLIPVKLHFITRGRLLEKGRGENVNGRFRNECSTSQCHLDLTDIQVTVGQWGTSYCMDWPDGQIGYLLSLKYRQPMHRNPNWRWYYR